MDGIFFSFSFLIVKALFSNEHCPTNFFFSFFSSFLALALSLIFFVYCLAIFPFIDCLIINGLLNCNIRKGYVVRVFVLRDVQCVDVFILFLIITLLLSFSFCVTHLRINNLCKHTKVYLYLIHSTLNFDIH